MFQAILTSFRGPWYSLSLEVVPLIKTRSVSFCENNVNMWFSEIGKARTRVSVSQQQTKD